MTVKNLKVVYKLLVSYGVIFIMLFSLGLLSLSAINMMAKKSVEYAEKTIPTVEEIGLTRRNMISVRRYLLNAIITQDAEDFERVSSSMKNDRQSLYDSLDVIESLNPEYTEDIDTIRTELKNVSAYNTQILQLAQTNDAQNKQHAYEIYLNTYAPAFDTAADQIIALNEKINENAKTQEAKVQMTHRVALILVSVVILIGILLVALFLFLMLRYIMVPLKKTARAMDALKEGDFEQAVIHYDSKDEFGQLAQRITQTMEKIIFITNDIEKGLSALAEGDFSVTSQDDSRYTGEYHRLRDTIYQMTHLFNQIIGKITDTANRVADGAEQVSNAAQALSQGSTEQASSVEELAATLSDISRQVNENNAFILESEHNVKETVSELQIGTQKMQEMLTAMNEITDSSVEIEKIIKNIEDIAFQTNILALNAAVEAARAGQAGKGFAVVADEVRNLAAKTAESSRNTAHLISKSLQAVQHGKQIADETATSFDKVSEHIARVAEQSEKISENSRAQDESIRQTSIGVEQISSVVQTNSATAQQSAAASEELAGLSNILQDIVKNFQLAEYYH